MGPSRISPTLRFGTEAITLRHWERLAQGALLAASPRIDGAVLLRRTFGFDALACSRCQGRMRVLATILDTDVAPRILAAVEASALGLAFARGPPTWGVDSCRLT